MRFGDVRALVGQLYEVRHCLSNRQLKVNYFRLYICLSVCLSCMFVCLSVLYVCLSPDKMMRFRDVRALVGQLYEVRHCRSNRQSKVNSFRLSVMYVCLSVCLSVMYVCLSPDEKTRFGDVRALVGQLYEVRDRLSNRRDNQKLIISICLSLCLSVLYVCL